MEVFLNSTFHSSTLSSESLYNETQFNETTDDDRNGDLNEIVRMMEIIARPIYITFGTVANLLSFYVMRRGSMREVSTCFYMSILALADTGVLWNGAFVEWIRHLTRWTVNPDVWTDCKFGFFVFFYFCCHYSSALLVMMSLEKFFALYFPLKAKSICTVKTAKWATSIAAIVLMAFDAQLFFTFGVQTDTSGNEYCTFLGVPASYESIFYRLNSVLYSFAPFTIMFLANSAIIYKFTAAKCWDRQEGTESTSQALSKSATRGTVMLVTVSFTFIILTGPVAFTFVITNSPSIILKRVVIMMSYLNHGINGVLYCIVGSRFRNELIKVLWCKTKRSDAIERTTVISNISVSENSDKHLTNVPTIA